MAEIQLVFDHAYNLTSYRTTLGDVLRPMVSIRLTYNGTSLDVDAMVDTGADFSMFHKDVATSLCIPDKQMKLDGATTLRGKVPVWYCPIGIDVLGKHFDCLAAFVDNPEWIPTIGRATIFSMLKFGFRQSEGQFYISSSP